MDRRSTDIHLSENSKDQRLSLSVSGVPRFTPPDELVHAAIGINNNSTEDAHCHLSVSLDSVVGTKQLLDQQVQLGPEQARTFGVPVRVPLAAEMSTAELRAIADCDSKVYETRQTFKVKPIEQPLFHAGFSIRNERGEEARGLIPRQSPIDITVRLQSPRGGIEGLKVLLRIMSRKDVVEEFEMPVASTSRLESEYVVKWVTPLVDLVTGYYLDVLILADGRILPSRAIEIAERQFTVY